MQNCYGCSGTGLDSMDDGMYCPVCSGKGFTEATEDGSVTLQSNENSGHA